MKKIKNAADAKMKVYKLGRMGTKWNEDGCPVAAIVPAERTTSMWYGDMFKDLYFKSEEDAREYLAKLRKERAEKASELETLVKDNVDLNVRIQSHCETRDDRSCEAYNEICKLKRILEWYDFAMGLKPVAWTHDDGVSRLNTLPLENGESAAAMRAEIQDVMDFYGHCTVSWNCSGHTRARWQTEAVCAWVEETHPEWKVENRGYDCIIRKRKVA